MEQQSSLKSPNSLLPTIFNHPACWWWTCLLPQLVLLLINGRAYGIIWDETATKDLLGNVNYFDLFSFSARQLILMSLSWEVFLLGLAFVAWGKAHRGQGSQFWKWCAAMLLGCVGYLWFWATHQFRILPSSIEPWILDSGDWTLQQFTFMMPAIFYCGVRLACFSWGWSRKDEYFRTISIAVLAPAAYYVLFLISRWNFRWPALVATGFFVLLTLLSCMALIRLLVLIYHSLQARARWGQTLLYAIIGIAGPIGGLMLNRQIPFPADFQSPWVYVLALINGLLLIVSTDKSFSNSMWIFLARSIFFPFSFYFFLVFLPFLPLALPAMFALGAGILFLVPVFLFMIHAQRWWQDALATQRQVGLRWTVVLGLAGILVFPTYFVAEAFYAKVNLKEALRYAYAPDFAGKDRSFQGNPQALRATLINLKEFKYGLQLPYLSGIYNHIVFENMVLPDKKIDYLFKFFIGEDLPPLKQNHFWGLNKDMRGRWWSERGVNSPPTEEQRKVSVLSTSVRESVEGPWHRSQLNLVLKNNSGVINSEFEGSLIVPEEVIITGFSLKIGEEIVPGQIFERRAAEWVYHMIRDRTRRDPGLLKYVAPGELSLNVFPFAAGEERVVQIDFLYPKGIFPKVRLQEQEIVLNEATGETQQLKPISLSDGKSSALVLPSPMIQRLPQVNRVPYIHFILDHSLGTKAWDEKKYLALMQAAVQNFPDVRYCRVTLANLDTVSISETMIPVERLAEQWSAAQRKIYSRGGVDLDRVIRQLVFEAKMAWDKENVSSVLSEPIFVFITSAEDKVLRSEKAIWSRGFYPEAENYYVLGRDGQLRRNPNSATKSMARSWIVLRKNGLLSKVDASGAAGQVAFVEDGSEALWEVFDSNIQKFIPMGEVVKVSKDSIYNRGILLRQSNEMALLNPVAIDRQLAQLVADSKSATVLIPSTSFIVLERSSQWKILKEKERQRIKTSAGLEFEEEYNVPEPSFWLLFFMLLYWWQKRRKNGFLKR